MSSSFSDILPSLPDFVQQWSIWGGSGLILKTLHSNGTIPYWACMSLTNIIVRSSLLPLVLHAAHTSARYAKVAPEIQFLVTLFNNEVIQMRSRSARPSEYIHFTYYNYMTLRQIYRLHKINPLAPFLAPLVQIPVFWYFSVDIRKIIMLGSDPNLAQQLADSSFLWIPDLTEPDPWYGLPILSGILLYLNVELALGRQSLSGPNASKSNMAIILKDLFQSVSIFMPAFMSQSSAGVQIYLATSFVFTMGQGWALRTNWIRQKFGLPIMKDSASSSLEDTVLAKGFLKLRQLEEDARIARGNGPILGLGVLAPGWETSFAGRYRKTSIQGSSNDDGVSTTTQVYMGPFIREIRKSNFVVPMESPLTPLLPSNNNKEKKEKEEEENNLMKKKENITTKEEKGIEYMASISEDVMEAANRGERFSEHNIVSDHDMRIRERRENQSKFNAKKYVQKQKNKKGKRTTMTTTKTKKKR